MENVAAIEGTVGQCLEENGYSLSLPGEKRRRSPWMRAEYPAFLNAKLWLKLHTLAGRCADMSALELEDEPLPVAQSAQS